MRWLNTDKVAQGRVQRTISHVTIDLSASYAKALREALPEAVLVADRFHLVRLAKSAAAQIEVYEAGLCLVVDQEDERTAVRCPRGMLRVPEPSHAQFTVPPASS